MLAVAYADVAATRVATADGRHAIDFHGRHLEARSGPQAYLVEMPAGAVIRPHFHPVDQYQIAVRGEGTFGKRVFTAGCLHYAERYTPYGPIVAGAGGLEFFTLRQRSTVEASFMPGSKRPVGAKTGRNLHFKIELASNGSDMARLLEKPEGVAVYRLEVRPGEPVQLPKLTHGGAFVVVLSGSMIVEGRNLPSRSCVHVASKDDRVEANAGDAGLVAAFMSLTVSVS